MKRPCKDFEDDKKYLSRLKTVINPVLRVFPNNRLPDNKMIVTTAGFYSLNKDSLEMSQYLKAGIITKHSQFLGVDNNLCNADGKINIPEANERNYGIHTDYYVPFEKKEIVVACDEYKDRISFINLDLQNEIDIAFETFINILDIMIDQNDFIISFNSMLATGWRSRLGHFETVKDGMPRLWLKNIKDYSNKKARCLISLLKPYKILLGYAYDGSGESSSVMGTYVFYKPSIIKDEI